MIFNGILNGIGEFAGRVPRYWEERGRNVIVEVPFDAVEDGGRSCICFSISIVVNDAGVLPSFKRLPTRLGVFPM